MPEGSLLDHMSKNKNGVSFSAGYLTPTQLDTEKLSTAFIVIFGGQHKFDRVGNKITSIEGEVYF